MAVVNQYKFFGLTGQDASSAGKKMFGTTIVPPVTGDTKQNPLINETYIVKSILITATATPVISITNNGVTIIKTAAFTANVSQELLTQPLIVEGTTELVVISSTSNAIDIGVSYLNILKEKLD
jgi:hypothetical protein